MLKATAGKIMPTTITGSLPRPSWYTENLGTRVVSGRDGDHRGSASSTSMRCRSICASRKWPGSTSSPTATAGSTRTSAARAGRAIRRTTWTGFDTTHPKLAKVGAGGIGFPRGHILHDYLEARVMPKIVGPVGRGEMQYAEIWKAAQRLTPKPVKFGTVTPELVAFAVQDEHYKDIPARIMAISDAFNEELHDLADAGCPVIQMEEPQIHLLAARGYVDKVINPEFMLKVFNNTVKGLRAKTEVWCHTCWGNPSQQRMFAQGAVLQAGARAAEPGRRRRDHVRDERARARWTSRTSGRAITEKKVGDRRDRSPHAAGGVAGGSGRRWCALALKVIPAERLVCRRTAAWGARA